MSRPRHQYTHQKIPAPRGTSTLPNSSLTSLDASHVASVHVVVLVGISQSSSFEDARIRNFDVSPSGGFVMCDYASRGEGGLLSTCELSQHGPLAVKRRRVAL